MTRTFRLGLFIVGTLLILATGVFLIGDRQSLFSRTYRISTTFKTVSGLAEGADVRIGGIHKGTVTHINLPAQPNGWMSVQMTLERSTRSVVRTDSIASIDTEGLLGNKFIDISFGSPSAQPIEPGGTIASAPPLELADLIKKTNEILDTTKSTMGSVEESAGHLKDISAKIDSGQGTVGALVNDKQMYTKLTQATTQAQQGATAFSEDMEALKHNFFLRGFFNDRGYQDAAQLTKDLIQHLPKAAAMQSFQYDVKKVFADADHAKLKNEKTMDPAGHYLEQTPFGLAVVVASSGMKGDSSQLQVLLEARAMVARDYLVKHFGMDDTKVKTLAQGKGAASTDTGTIEVLVYPPAVSSKSIK